MRAKKWIKNRRHHAEENEMEIISRKTNDSFSCFLNRLVLKKPSKTGKKPGQPSYKHTLVYLHLKLSSDVLVNVDMSLEAG